jgi:hypothetical protein
VGVFGFYEARLQAINPTSRTATRSVPIAEPKGASPMAWFYEIRSSNNAVLKRDGGFASQDAAKTAGREDAKKMKNMHQSDRPDVGRIMVGQNKEEATRY